MSISNPSQTGSEYPAPVALLGGTFDPIHRGHTQPALQLADLFGWSSVHLQPTFAPPHRSVPAVSDAHRWNMVKLACEDDPRLVADDFELSQQQPTRTVHTLAHLQHRHPNASLCFIMGMDSFINFTSWLDWPGILERAHLFVLPRPGYSASQIPSRLRQFIVPACETAPAIFSRGAGKVYVADTHPINISATELRAMLASTLSSSAPATNPYPTLLAPQVYAYIRRHNLYR